MTGNRDSSRRSHESPVTSHESLVSPPHHPIRSYVLRQGRLTAAQARARAELMPRYGIPYAPELLFVAR